MREKMEPEVVIRGRKRKRKDVQSSSLYENAKEKVAATRCKVLVGRYVTKEFLGNGVFLGKVVSYDRGLYRVDYEDGNCVDLESREVKAFLVEEDDMDDDFCKRKKNLDEHVLNRYAKDEAVQPAGIANPVETVSSGSGAAGNAAELVNHADKFGSLSHGSVFEVGGNPIEVDRESSDVSDSEQSCDLDEVEPPMVPAPQLPPSSGNIGISEEHVSYLLSVYGFLRSFSVCLFLSPFMLDEFVGCLNSPVHNTLLDAIHVALMRTLKNRLEILSADGLEVASKCLRSMDWSLLDSLTWPVFIVQYLMTMRYTVGPEWKEFYVDVLERDYYSLPAGRKLIILQLLCDDALDSTEVRAEIDIRQESEFGVDPDGVTISADESVPRTFHLRRSKTHLKDEEAVKNDCERHTVTLSSSTSSLSLKATGPYTAAAAHVDEDANGDECRLCGMDGLLLCCDGCPSAYHSRCIGVTKMFIPQGAWYCPECMINRIVPNVTWLTSLRGATFFGVDPYEQVFLGTCDHLLVMKASGISEQCLRYYAPNDIQKVLCVLNYSVECRAVYSEICKGILQYWKIPEDMSSLTESVGSDKVLVKKMLDGGYSIPCTFVAKEGSNAAELLDTENVLSGVTVVNSEDTTASFPEVNCTKGGFDHASLGKAKGFHQLDQRMVDYGSHDGNCKDSDDVIVGTTWPTCSAGFQPSPPELNQQSTGAELNIKESAPCTSGNGHCNNKNCMITAGDLSYIFPDKKEGNQLSSERDYASSIDDCMYLGLSFKPQKYLNVYAHGDFAVSAAASLAILSSERISQPQPLGSHRKTMSANYSLQIKAFSLAAKRFYWPNYERKLVEVPRERCGWCLTCKATINSKRGCLLNAAAANATKGAAKMLASLRPSKNVERSLASIATYVISMEENLCGLTTGPFQNPTYRKQWHRQVEQAATLSAIKAPLLEFEGSIRSIAFSADWAKLVDDRGLENPVTQSASSVVGSTHKHGSGRRRGRRPSRISEVTTADCDDASTGFAWWRGGTLSKHVFHKGILPQSIIKNAARQGGSRKINGVHYIEGFEVPKRSRQFVWRAAVETSKTVSQLALQVRHLDQNMRWNDLVRPEQPQDGKGAETEASAFRNACIVDKKIVENKIIYGVVFENQKHLPSRVLKNSSEVEESGGRKEKYWFLEAHIPLYLIKEYEKVEEVIFPSADEHVNPLSNLQRQQLEASGKDIFSFLSKKRDNLGRCLCTFCQLDVPFRNAARCSACQGYCHEQCTVASTSQMKEHADSLITCNQCYHEKTINVRNEDVGDSPTSPLPLQGQESQPIMTLGNGGKRHDFLESLDQSSEKKVTINHPKVTKGGKQNGKNHHSASVGTLDQSSEKKLATNHKKNGCKRLLQSLHQSSGKKPTNASSLGIKKSRSNLSFGLIWKKKNPKDTGIDFRLKNILLKDNPNRHLLAPVCYLCMKQYNSELMYICCETCKKWYHAEAVELKESKILDLVGFKCCRCRRIRSPSCPYMDPETKKKLEAKKLPSMVQSPTNLGTDSNSEINDESADDWQLDATPAIDTEEAAVNIQENDSLLSSLRVEQVNEHNTGAEFECGAGPIPEPGTLKVPCRRDMKPEKESDASSADNLAFEPSTTYVESMLNPSEETSTPMVELDVSMNGFEDDMMLDYESLNHEDMEIDPQMYFSLNELLASDYGVLPDEVNPSGDMTGNWDNSSAAARNDHHREQYHTSISYDQQAPMFSVESAADMVPCRLCSKTEPCPDLYCLNCGLWIHDYCSPWDEPSWEGGWKCGKCRESR